MIAPILTRLGELRALLKLGPIDPGALWDYPLSDGWRFVLNAGDEKAKEPDGVRKEGLRPTNCGFEIQPYHAYFYRHGMWQMACDCKHNGFIEPVFDLATARIVNKVMEDEIRRLGGEPAPFRWPDEVSGVNR